MKNPIKWIKGWWYYNVMKKISTRKKSNEIIELYYSFFNLSEVFAESIEKYNANLPLKIRKEILMDICSKYIHGVSNFDANQYLKLNIYSHPEDFERRFKITKDGLEIDKGSELFLETNEILDLNISNSQERNFFRLQAMCHDLINVYDMRNLKDFVGMYIKEESSIKKILKRAIDQAEWKIIYNSILPD